LCVSALRARHFSSGVGRQSLAQQKHCSRLGTNVPHINQLKHLRGTLFAAPCGACAGGFANGAHNAPDHTRQPDTCAKADDNANYVNQAQSACFDARLPVTRESAADLHNFALSLPTSACAL
jgi:hypothetical protein